MSCSTSTIRQVLGMKQERCKGWKYKRNYFPVNFSELFPQVMSIIKFTFSFFTYLVTIRNYCFTVYLLFTYCVSVCGQHGKLKCLLLVRWVFLTLSLVIPAAWVLWTSDEMWLPWMTWVIWSRELTRYCFDII